MPAAPTTQIDDAPPLLIKKLVEKARVPTRGSAFAAGYDLYAAAETSIPAKGKGLVSTGLSMATPAGTCEYHVFSMLLLNLHYAGSAFMAVRSVVIGL